MCYHRIYLRGENTVKRNYECKVRKGKQLVGVLTEVNSSVEVAWAYFEKESRRLGGVISDFKCLR